MFEYNNQSSFKKIAFKAMGGQLKALYYHIGVALALEDVGFKFVGGLKNVVEEKDLYGGNLINPLIGSSAGSVFVSLIAMGFSLEEVIQCVTHDYEKTNLRMISLEQIRKGAPWHPKAYIERVKKNCLLRTKENKFHWKSVDVEDLVSAISASHTINGLEEYFRLAMFFGEHKRKHIPKAEKILKKRNDSFESLQVDNLYEYGRNYKIEDIISHETFYNSKFGKLNHNNFQDYRADIFILAVELNEPRTVVFCNKQSEQIDDYIYKNNATVSEAISASCTMPWIFEPFSIKEKDGELVYYIDGDIRNPYTTNIAKDHNCDLIFVSSIYQPYTFDPAIGSLHQFGLGRAIHQFLDQDYDAKLKDAVYLRRRKKEALSFFDNVLIVHLKESGKSSEDVDRIREQFKHSLDIRYECDPVRISPKPKTEEAMKLYKLHPLKLSGDDIQFLMEYGRRRTFETFKELGIKI